MLTNVTAFSHELNREKFQQWRYLFSGWEWVCAFREGRKHVKEMSELCAMRQGKTRASLRKGMWQMNRSILFIIAVSIIVIEIEISINYTALLLTFLNGSLQLSSPFLAVVIVDLAALTNPIWYWYTAADRCTPFRLYWHKGSRSRWFTDAQVRSVRPEWPRRSLYTRKPLQHILSISHYIAVSTKATWTTVWKSQSQAIWTYTLWHMQKYPVLFS